MANVTAVTKKEKYKTEISAGEKRLIADEPNDLGGKDLGFSPDELMAASLASCTSITLRMYADRKEWNIDEIHVNVDFSRDASTQISSFTRKINITGNLGEKEKSRLLTIANSCPMHKVLSNTIEIGTDISFRD